MKLHEHRHALDALMVWLIVWHLAIAGLHLIGRAVPAIDPDPSTWWGLIASHADGVAWPFWHGGLAVALTVSLISRRPRWSAMTAWLSGGLWVAWGLLLLMWSLATVPPVSLTAPALILLACAPVAFVVSGGWRRRSED
ncbi:hypothetical protein ACQCX2_17545 [Propionibacteriaceae bacterium Y1700]|uniref:hypothetical protein n=1 Tax=Microlunatus sp. Y1700 TaxID=3418487 RepID=UPI003DA7141E